METIQPRTDESAKKAQTGHVVFGILLLLPALFCCLSQLLLPTLNTFLMSFQKVDLFGSETVYVGMENYSLLFDYKDIGRATGFTLLTLLIRLLVVALVPLFLAWAVGQFGRRVRLGLRILLTVPIVLFAPVAIAVTWQMFLHPSSGLFLLEESWAASPASVRSTLLFIDALYFFGLASGVGLIIFLPIWHRSAGAPTPTSREALKPMLVTWALGILGVIALTLSTFTLNLVLTNGGPLGSTSTLGILLYQFAFRNFQIGPGAVIASLILLVTLVLGIVAGFLVILSRLRLDLVDQGSVLEKADQPIAPKGNRVFPGIVLALLGLLTLGACLFGALPFGWLIPQAQGGDGLERLLEEVSAGRLFINTFMPPLVTATLQVLIAYLAALGIGALRPFGKRSEWLLLLFSPWLFIGVLPLSLSNFMAAQKADLLNTFSGSISPILFSIPALFILTIFFAGRASRLQPGSQDAANFFKHFILPSLPLVAVLWLVLSFFNGQDVLWPLLVSASPERYNLNLMLLRLVGMYSGGDSMLVAAVTFFVLPACVFFFLCLALFQVFYLDRLTLYSENPS